MVVEPDFSDGRRLFADVSGEGSIVIDTVVDIKPGKTVVYHVGLLPRDVEDPSLSYRTGDVKPKEINNIMWFAEDAVRRGKCRLETARVTDDVVVYYAVGI